MPSRITPRPISPKIEPDADVAHDLLAPRAPEQRAAALDRLDRADVLDHEHGHDQEGGHAPGEAETPETIWPTMPARSEIQRRIMPTVAAMTA
jgi:hypothetical protein